MKTTQRLIATLVAIVMTLSCFSANAGTFRGIERFQGNNLLYSDVLNRLTDFGEPFYLDVTEGFNRDGNLHNSDADGLQIGFVPPTAGVPNGPLQGTAAAAHGRWTTLQGDLVTSSLQGGYVSSQTGPALASTPWRVEPFLGDYYYLDMTARVAAGETVSLGYIGDISTLGSAQGLDGLLGQLALHVARGEGANADRIDWIVSWAEGDIVRTLNSSTTAPEGDELLLQLGWLDNARGDDLFDAWIGTETSNQRLVSGSIFGSIDVFSVGFEVSGPGSQIGGFASAVPEPSAGLLGMLSLVMIVAVKRRR